jgi:hypothetical protein
MSYRVEEITVNGVAYRGPLPCNSPTSPWRITAFLASRAVSTSGQRVGHSWQTWGRYESEAACRAALDDLRAQAANAQN